jgi:hypothetical protein
MFSKESAVGADGCYFFWHESHVETWLAKSVQRERMVTITVLSAR